MDLIDGHQRSINSIQSIESCDDWILTKLLMNSHKKFIALKKDLEKQIIRMPDISKNCLIVELEEALKSHSDVSYLAESLLNKNFLH